MESAVMMPEINIRFNDNHLIHMILESTVNDFIK